MKRATSEEEQSAGTGVVTAVGPVPSAVRTRLDPVPGKFQIPSQPDSYVQRSRLFEELELGVGGPLTLVSSPAGTGKTVLVSAWASRAQVQRRLVWVTLEAGDRSRTRFWSLMTEALRRCGIVTPSGSQSSGAQSPTEEQDDGYVDLLVSALHEAAQPAQPGQVGPVGPVVVVLDCDMEVPAAVAQDLDLLLRHSRGWLRLVLLTRVDPVLPLHRYRLDGSLVEVRMADLAFTPPEARELMTRAGVVLSGVALQALVDRTQGWAAGLRFAAVSLSGRVDQDHAALGFSGHTGNVAEYLIAEVLDSQPAGGRQLFLETSVVDVLQPGLCEAVAGPHAQRSLDRLVRGNAFLTELPDAPGCYRYQPLFLELLRSQLASDMPERVPELHRAAAAWMFDQGRVEGAVRHAAAAGDWQGAARYLIEDLAIGRLLVPAGCGCAEVLARLPEDLEGVAPSVVRAALAIAAFNVEACEEHLRRAERELAGVRTSRWHSAALALQTVRLAHAVAVANPEEGLGAAAAAERLMHLQLSDRLEEHPELSVLIASGRGAAWLTKGSLDDAADAFSEGARAADRSGCESLLIDCLGHLALLAAIRGQLRKANELAARVAHVQHQAHLDEASCPTASVAMAWVNTELYDLPVARRGTQRAAELVEVSHDFTSRVMLALVDSRGRRARGDVDGALARITEIPSEVPAPTQWLQDVLSIEEAELTVASGEPERAVQLVEGLAQQGSAEGALVLARARMAIGAAFEPPAATFWSSAGSLQTRVGGWLFEATRQLEGGRELRAVQALERSLRLAAPERLRRPFREASPQVRQLLRGARQLTSEHSWLGAATLDDAHQPPQPARPSRPRHEVEHDDSGDPQAESPILETLTEKEREVLGHLAQLLTTDEIAGAMFVSVNTVRTHVRNILRKLAASRRNEAVRRARELGIIADWAAAEPRGRSARGRSG